MEDIVYMDLVYRSAKNWLVKLVDFAPGFIVGLLIFVITFYLSRFLSHFFVKIFEKTFPKGRNQDTIVAMVGVFRFVIILAGSFVSLEVMGLNGFFMKFLGSLGVAGIIAGVALKDLVSSIFSGMLVGIDKSFKVSDQVSIKGITGVVEEIGFLTTKVINDEGKKVYIPNQLIFDSPFINISASSQRKVIIEFEIPTSENLEKSKKTLMEEVQTIPYNDSPEKSEVLFIKQQSGMFILQVKFWMKQGENFAKVKSETIVRLKSKLDTEGIKTDTNTNA